jgi:hypothetical protein
MKLIKYIVVFLVVAYAAITVLVNYMGDFSYSNDGGYVSASECSSPESQAAILYCGELHCLNIMKLDKLISFSDDINLKGTRHSFSNQPDKVEIIFVNRTNNKTIQCNLNKSAVIDVAYVAE